ncbi:cytochrome c [Halopseudomonas bauzanensis]|uniref:c-type cytochrome n=1 Tax=Halopseudomonas bauzanensis TaxID=653930 RepID=UPI0035253589
MRGRIILLLTACIGLLAGCSQAMEDQPKYTPYEQTDAAQSGLWPRQQSARLPVAGTVARGESLEPPAEQLPVPLTMALLKRGQQQYDTFCVPCHGLNGAGDGMVVQRGFPAPPSYHIARLRQAPLKHFYDVIADGYGVMYSYGARVPPAERWAIAAYIRALQLSQHAHVSDLTPAQRASLAPSMPEGRP